MRRKDIRICIMRVGGTNCDEETRRAFGALGVEAEVVHLRSVLQRLDLLDYHGLVFPGGFAYGDYVRAGAVWADILRDELGGVLDEFVKSGFPILGICNGFQVLTESGLLPGLEAPMGVVEAALACNAPAGYRCTWTTINDYLYVRQMNSGKCIFTRTIPKGTLLRIPIAHAEGRLLLSSKKKNECCGKLLANDQIVFTYARADGSPAEGVFPYNPNGSMRDIAGICSGSGTVMGLMPHPERAFFGYQLPDWTQKTKPRPYGDGKLIFESMIDYIMDRA